MSPILLPITLVTAGGAAIIAFWLAMRTGAARRAAKVSIGDGGNEPLIRRMRAQANFGEYAPYIILLVALIEFTAGTSTWLWIASAAFLLARVAHAFGMDGVKGGREAGTAVTFTLLLGLGVYAVVLPFLGQRAPAPQVIEQTVPAG